MRVVIDTGVWISALISTTGAPAQVVAAMATGRITVVASPRLLAELSGVISQEKFRRWFSAAAGQAFVTELAHRVDLCPDIDKPQTLRRDVSDDYWVALAQAQQARLVSVDRDVLDADLDPPALSPRQLLELLAQR